MTIPECDRETFKALKFAIESEKQALLGYINLALKTVDIYGKNMLLRIARDEFAHMEALEKELEHCTECRDWKDIELEESDLEKIAPRVSEYVGKIKGKEGVTEIDALEIALKQEKEAINFYKEQAEKTNNPNAKKLFKRLVEMETAHYDLILAELDYIKQTGFWFGIPEFSMENRF